MKPRALGKERGNMKEWAEWFYKSKEWAQTRDAYMVAQHYLCERCGEPAKIVHHKIWLTPKNITIVGRNEAGFSFTFAKDAESTIEPQFKAHPLDKDGTLLIFDEDIVTEV